MASEPTDPEQMKADMRKCPRWILLKLQSERQEGNKASQNLAQLTEQIEKTKQLLPDLKKKEEDLLKQRRLLDDIGKRITTVEEELHDKDQVLKLKEKDFEQKAEEINKYKNLMKEVQAVEKKADNQVKALFQTRDSEINQQLEQIAKLEAEAARYRNFLRNLYQLAAQQPVKRAPAVVQAKVAQPKVEELDTTSAINIRHICDIFTQNFDIRVNFYKKFIMHPPEYSLVKNIIQVLDSTAPSASDVRITSLLYFFELHSSVETLKMLNALITMEVEKSKDDFTTLFRGNSSFLKIFRVFTNITGLSYLSGILLSLISEVVKNPESLEVDPTKASPGEELDINRVKLKDIAQKFLNKIFFSINTCPMQFRIVFKHLAQEVRKQFTEQTYEVIAGFLFLRFICPALAAPDRYEFTTGTELVLNDQAKRNFILISKVLQNVANGVAFKEEWLSSMNDWVVQNNVTMRGFIDKLIDIGDTEIENTDNFAPSSMNFTMEDAVHDLESVLFEIRGDLLSRYVSATEVYTEGMNINTGKLLFLVILALGVPIKDTKISFQENEPVVQTFIKLLSMERLVPAICKQSMKRKKDKPSELSAEQVAGGFVRLWNFCNKVVELVKAVIKAEIFCTDYMFVHSFAGKIFLHFGQLFAGDIMKNRLGPLIQRLKTNNVHLEIELDRLPDDSKNTLSTKVAQLQEWAQNFVTQILQGLNESPKPIWEICHFVQGADFMGQKQDITEFILLAWICPLIENPLQFGLFSEPLTPRMQRNLFLLSDVLRNISKGTLFFSKDGSLNSLNQFIESTSENVINSVVTWCMKSPQGSYTPIPCDWKSLENDLSLIHKFMFQKATSFYHVLGEDKIIQPISYKMVDYLDVLIPQTKPAKRTRPQPTPQPQQPQPQPQTQHPHIQIQGPPDGEKRSRVSLTPARSFLFNKKRLEEMRDKSGSPPMEDKKRGSIVLARERKVLTRTISSPTNKPIDDPEMTKAKDKLLESLTSFYSNETPEERSKRLRKEVLGELISTEAGYIRNLECIQKYLMEPLRGTSIVTEEEFQDLFGNVDDLINVGHKLLRNLQGLEDLTEEEQAVGSVFFWMKEELATAYKPYCVNMHKSIKLREQLQNRTSFVQYIENATSNPEFTAQKKLDNILIQPMQRICRYPLLLQELLKRTPQNHMDRSDIPPACEAIEDVINQINESRVQLERTEKLLDILDQFNDKRNINLLVVGREYVTEGPIKRIKSPSGYTGKGYLFLFSDLLVIAQPTGKKYTLQMFVPLDACVLTDAVDELKHKHSLEVQHTISDAARSLITFTSEEEKESWKLKIHQQQAFLITANPLTSSDSAN